MGPYSHTSKLKLHAFQSLYFTQISVFMPYRSAQYVTLHKYFLYPSLVIYFFYPGHKTKTGAANRWETTTNSNPPGSIKLSNRSRAGVKLCLAFLSVSANCAKYVLCMTLLSRGKTFPCFFPKKSSDTTKPIAT